MLPFRSTELHYPLAFAVLHQAIQGYGNATLCLPESFWLQKGSHMTVNYCISQSASTEPSEYSLHIPALLCVVVRMRRGLTHCALCHGDLLDPGAVPASSHLHLAVVLVDKAI